MHQYITKAQLGVPEVRRCHMESCILNDDWVFLCECMKENHMHCHTWKDAMFQAVLHYKQSHKTSV